jgi:thiol-disulfide isomerase/thioredoxin
MQDRNLYLILGVCFLGFYFSHPWNGPSKGKPVAMAFTATDGSHVDLSAMRGKVVLVDFWATWCGPCVAELPHVKAAYEKLHGKGFEIVGISFDEDKEELQKFVKSKGVPWSQYFDGKGWQNKYGEQYGIHSIPSMWLVDKKGVLRDLDAREDLAGKVEKLLAE